MLLTYIHPYAQNMYLVGLRTATGTTPASVPEQLPMTRSAGRSGGGGGGGGRSTTTASVTVTPFLPPALRSHCSSIKSLVKCGAPHQNNLYKSVVVEKKIRSYKIVVTVVFLNTNVVPVQ
jgi:hypothetical protein